jgi:murein L,D-transpeptidase YcbB/YkuD
MNATARDIYLSSLDPKAELNARRLAERSRVPDDDPMWLLLHEMQQATRELTRGANAALTNDAFAERLSSTVASSITNDQRIIAAVADGIAGIHDVSVRAIRSLESEVRDVARKSAIAPISSLVFALALALIAGFAAMSASYNVGSGYGFDAGYHVGYHDRVLYERIHK